MRTLIMLVRANLAERTPQPGDTTLRAGQYALDNCGTHLSSDVSVWTRLRHGVSY